MNKQPILVGGQWRLGRGDPMRSVFPADGSVTAELNAASLEDVEDAIAAGDSAWQASGWFDRLPHERASVLYRVSELIMARQEALAALQTRDNGKPMAETRNLVASAAATARYYAAVLETLDSEITAPRLPDVMTLSQYEPLGVVAAITPWNSPIASEMQKIAPALAAGNAVIVKPAEATPLLALELGKLFEEAGLPPGLLSVLPGKGSIIGEAICRHPKIRRISFTGGTRTGRHLAHIAADKLISASLELGGKSPTIICPDADVEQAVKGVVFGIFSSAGQACIAGSRLFIHDHCYDAVMERLLSVTQSLRVGHPENEGTHISPLISPEHRNSVAHYVDLARADGGQVLCGGAIPDDPDLAVGNYYLPTIITGLAHESRACQEEIFGPVLVVFRYHDEQELIHLANDNIYGLAAGIWSQDTRYALQLAKRLAVGTVWINTYKKFSISTPFGGYKDSGLGREKGRQGILAYMQQKSLYVGLSKDPIAWSE